MTYTPKLANTIQIFMFKQEIKTMFKYKRVLAALLLQFILVGASLAVEVEWRPTAQNTPQIDTYTVTGTWAAGVPDTASITCNNKTLTVSIGSDTAVADIADIVARMVNATSATENIKTDETRNNGGYEYGEFRDVIASTSGANLIFTSAKLADGSYPPFTITVAETTAGSGSLGSKTATQVGTGLYHFNNTSNWIGGSVPTTGDSPLFDRSGGDVRYALNNAVEAYNLKVTNRYAGTIGLKSTNTNWSGHPYDEYRDQFLVSPNTVTTGVQAHEIGDKHGTGEFKGEVYLDCGTDQGVSTTLTVYSSKSVKVIGGELLHVLSYGGATLVGGNPTDDMPQLESVTIYGGGVQCNRHTRMETTFSGITMTDGTLLFQSLLGADPDITMYGGTITTQDTTTLDDVIIKGGVLICGDNINALIIEDGGEYQDYTTGGTRTIADAIMYSGAIFRSPNRKPAFTDGIYLDGCTREDVTIELPSGLEVNFIAH